MQILECVPNFSEGRDKSKIWAIQKSIEAIEGVKILNIDIGYDANRTVFTFLGPPEAMMEAAFAGIARASELIDMREHSGNHPRIGASDVCPFVPIANIDINECVELSKKVAEKVGRELGVPVYLYENSANVPMRQNLADIRRGQYEGLAEKMKDKEWRPDFGPTTFNAKAGATVIGAREFLIAFNINLGTKDVAIANDIARLLRTSGYIDENGQKIAGQFPFCKALGWFVDEFGCAQVSMNLTNHKMTPIYKVMQEARYLAEQRGIKVTGSQLVGMVPYDAILECGYYYMKLAGQEAADLSEDEILEFAVKGLGLRDYGDFEIKARVLDWQRGLGGL